MEVDVEPQLSSRLRLAGDLQDATEIDLKKQVQRFLTALNVTSVDGGKLDFVPAPTLVTLKSVHTLQVASCAELLAALSRTLAITGLSEHVLYYFGPLVTDLLARWCDDARTLGPEESERKLFVLAEMASLRPAYWGIIYDFLEQSAFLEGTPFAHIGVDSIANVSPTRLQLLLLSYYRILGCDAFVQDRYAWNAAPLVTLFNSHPDRSVRYMALQTYVRFKGIQEQVRLDMEEQYVGDIAEVDVEIPYGWEVKLGEEGGIGSSLELKMLDGWMIRLQENARMEKAAESQTTCSYETLEEGSSTGIRITEGDLSRRATLVAGSLAFRRGQAANEDSPSRAELHIDIVSHKEALREMVSLLALRLPILLTSRPSAGKTHTIRHLANLLYPATPINSKLLTISLADTSVDAKALIGNYVSSPTAPGTFVWAEGALVKAMRTGRWIVLEDLDKATLEVQSLFSRLADSLSSWKSTGARAVLQVPGQAEVVEASQDFAIIATRTAHSQGPTPAPIFLGSHYYQEVQLPEADVAEVEQILCKKFPTLAGHPVDILFRAYQQILQVGRDSMHRSGRSARSFGLRDLERWCSRVTQVLSGSVNVATHTVGDQIVFSNTVVQEEVFLEAYDIFLASLDTSQLETRKRREAFGESLALSIGLNKDRYRWLVDTRSPVVEITGDKRARQAIRARVGRTNLHGLAPRPHRISQTGRPFAMTKPSALLLERVAVGVNATEPLLLVGETGTGKTTAVQYLADSLERPLTVLNLSMQTESGDLLGGFKPVEAAGPARELYGKWVELFRNSFSRKKNEKFEIAVRKAVHESRWKRVAEMLEESGKLARAKLVERLDKRGLSPKRLEASVVDDQTQMQAPSKRRKLADDQVSSSDLRKMVAEWDEFLPLVMDFVTQHVMSASRLVFAFVEGPLVKCLRNGEWLLLDEVNLASMETLESLSSVLESAYSSVILTEKGDLEPVPRHPAFRIFACMNPATDVGKKDLPGGLRTRFTEIYVPPPDDDRDALLSIVKQYLGDASAGDPSLVLDVAEFYVSIKALAKAKHIVDGTNTPPHYSMRTLARALTFAVDVARAFGVRRGLWEGCMMTFTMSLDDTSAVIAKQLCDQSLLRGFRNAKAVISQVPAAPTGSTEDSHIRFGHYWLSKGSEALPATHDYIITSSVQAKLLSLARTIMTRKYPVLIQGPTSSGKTSAIEFMARQTGHKFIRINNHEHTDIQEYLGSYAADPETGKLVFQEGALVDAVRHGHWIVLDELNLAPTDVLEALNRLLDDNRELVLPETQEVVKPHPDFMLFATQNPPGLYAGRKILSRAFRNRFLEVHFEDVPKEELETILCQRCRIPPSYAHRIVEVFQELRHRRQATRVFESSQSFATLRDLFRWANRSADSYQQLADHGYMLLAERSRSVDDRVVVREVLESVMKVKIDEQSLYDVFSALSAYGCLPDNSPLSREHAHGVIWTSAMRRLFTLTAVATHYKEPLLLVGETGCGKTSVCQTLAEVLSRNLVAVNCHQNMEAADLLGSQRPVRDKVARLSAAATTLAGLLAASGEEVAIPDIINNAWLLETISLLRRKEISSPKSLDVLDVLCRRVKGLDAMFEWHNGPLVDAMQQGSLFLLDELSLADDSVLERLNSVLEPGRTLLLAERGGVDAEGNHIVAAQNFGVVATMNPGGDFGKKELSPALRNRFTEVWVPAVDVRADLDIIIAASWRVRGYEKLGPLMLDFLEWFDRKVVPHSESGIGLRDVLAWIGFTEACLGNTALDILQVFRHGAAMVIVDGLESLPTLATAPSGRITTLRELCWAELDRLCGQIEANRNWSSMPIETSLVVTEEELCVGPFKMSREEASVTASAPFALTAPTTLDNLLRIVRASQLPKSILLEGSPGVGKTSLVSALATLCGRDLCRINLSEQTDLVDLFGADLPVTGSTAGTFAWVDAGFLRAMKRGDWVLLDEMNLASQAVLEGLNAVLDHRGSVFIPELGRSFDRHPSFRVFAAQNPLHQGGGRKGLPKSFLNRFTKVYIREMNKVDLTIICSELFPATVNPDLAGLIDLTECLVAETTTHPTFGSLGSPWEFNLRDVMRVFSMSSQFRGIALQEDLVRVLLDLIYVGRFRTAADQKRARDICEAHMQIVLSTQQPWSQAMPTHNQIGITIQPRLSSPLRLRHQPRPLLRTLHQRAALMTCLSAGTMAILVGARGCGKREAVRSVAGAAGISLREFSLHPGVDTLEMLGSYEQSSAAKHRLELAQATSKALGRLAEGCSKDISTEAEHLMASLRQAVRFQLERASAGALDQDDVLHQISQSLQFLRVCISTREYEPLAAMLAAVHASTGKASFEWLDGPLISALQAGDWFLISDANLCSGSVLDRLNSLCEAGGSLVLSERGTSATGVPTYQPHPEFRLILAFDPQNGELSRAMRNRGVEIHFDAVANPDREHGLAGTPSTICPVALMSESSSESGMHQEVMSLRALEIQDHPKVAYMLAARAARDLPRLDRWGPFGTPKASIAFRRSTLRNIMSWRQGRLAVLDELSTADAAIGELLPIDFTINRSLGHLPETRIIYRILQADVIFGQAAPSVTGSAGAVSFDRSTVLRSLLCELSVLMRLHLHEELQALLQTNLRIDIVLTGLRDIAQLGDSLRLLEEQISSLILDYTRVVLVVRTIRRETVMNRTSRELGSVLARLDNAVAVTRGLGQLEIWTAFAEQYFDHARLDMAARLVKCLQNPLDRKLRRSVVDLLAELNGCLGRPSQLADTVAELESMPNIISTSPTDLRLNVPEQGVLFRARLSVMASACDQTFCRTLADVMLDVTSTRSLEWATISHGANRSPRAQLPFQAYSDFLLSVFPLQAISDDLATEAGLTELPVFSMATSVTRLDVNATIGNLMEHRCHVATLAKLLFEGTVSGNPLTKELWLSFGFDVLRDLLRCFGEVATCGSAECPDWSAKWLALRKSVINAPAQVALERWIAPLFVAQPVADEDHRSARLWLRLGLFLWDLYVTNVPYDPAEEYSVDIDMHALARQRLEDEIEVYRSVEAVRTGNATTPAMVAARADLQVLGPPPKRPRLARDGTSDPERLNGLFAELHTLQKDLLSPSRLLELEHSLEQGEDNAAARANALQSSLASLTERMQVTQAGLADLIAPILLAISAIRVGVSLGTTAHKARAARASKLALARVIEATSTYPAVSVRQDLLEISEIPPANMQDLEPFDTVVLGLAVRVQDVINGHNVGESFFGIMACFDRLFALWQIDQKRAALREQASESMYRQRTKDQDVLSDEAQEAAEFEKLFPNFEQDDLEFPSEYSAASTGIRTGVGRELTGEQIRLVYRLHMAAFGARPRTPQSGTAFENLQREIVLDAVVQDHLALECSADTRLKPFNVKILAESSRQFAAKVGLDYNFYHDSNIAESLRACSIIHRLTERLAVLLTEWPEQMVLQHIQDRCGNMGRMSATSSVARLLPAFEQLLEHTNDWEAYANKENSLKPFRDEIVETIISWRKLELSLWHRIIPQQTVAYDEEVSSWLFKLYEMVIVAMRTLNGTKHGEIPTTVQDQHLSDVHSLLNDFMASSTVGHFSARLSLLDSFGQIVANIGRAHDGSEGDLAIRLQTMLGNFVTFYRQYEAPICAHLRDDKEKLEKSVSDYVKLASWKDVNIQALKASAHKSHVQLFKLVRKHRNALQQRIAPYMVLPELVPSGQVLVRRNVLQEQVEESAPRRLLDTSQIRANLSLASDLGDLSTKARIFRTKAKQLENFISPDFSSDLESYLQDLRDELDAFAQETSSLKGPDVSKLAKNLVTRKRRALADGMKELRRMGFSYKVRADAMHLQGSAALLHLLPPLSGSVAQNDAFWPILRRIEDYHHRLEVRMPSMRAALPEHHASLTTNDLQRVHGMVESVFEAALALRAKLTGAVSSAIALSRLRDRFSACTAEESTTVLRRSPIRATMVLVLDTAACLQECSERLADLQELRPEAALSPLVVAHLDPQIAALLAVATALKPYTVDAVYDKLPLAPQDVAADMLQAPGLVRSAQNALSAIRQVAPLTSFLITPVIGALDKLLVSQGTDIDETCEGIPGAAEATLTGTVGDSLLAQMLVSVQDLAKAAECEPKSCKEDDALSGPDLKLFLSSVDANLGSIRLERVLREASATVEKLHVYLDGSSTADVLSYTASKVLPFLSEYLHMTFVNLSNLSAATKSVYKMAHMLCDLSTDLTAKGFCMPDEDSGQEGQEQAAAGTGDATGFGQGTGQDNVTDTIEDEAQVEGLQGEDEGETQPEGQQKQEGKDDSHEMQDDFEGNLDHADDESGDQDPEGGEGEDGEEDIDDHVGDVGDDAVDEQFWSGEQDGQDGEQEPPLNPSKDQADEKPSDEVAAKEAPTDKSKEKREPASQADPNEPEEREPDEGSAAGDVDDDDHAGDADPAERQNPPADGDAQYPEVEPLAIPDDLKLDEPLDRDSDGEDESMQSMEEDANSISGNSDGGAAGDDHLSMGDPDAAPDAGDEVEPQDTQEVFGNDDPREADAGDQADGSGTGGEAAPSAARGAQNRNHPTPENDDATRETEDESHEGEVGTTEDAAAASGGGNADDEDQRKRDSGAQPDAPDAAGAQSDTRSFGTSLAEVRRLMSEILEQTSQERLETGASAAEQQAGAMEHVAEDEDADMEALGAANESRRDRLAEMQIVDQQQADDQSHAMDVDVEETSLDQADTGSRELPQRPDVAGTDQVDKALTRAQVAASGDGTDGPGDLHANPDDTGVPREEDAPIDDFEETAAGSEIITPMDVSDSRLSEERGDELWRKYAALTNELSFQLCEQMRLILEPTLATRLQGDFRSGKRLNMRKIIPYIASEYTKDKIWLRRTKPSRREYQVLLSLDDSRSMADSQSVHLAYQTMALVSQALSKLEVGQISVAKFGDNLEVLHPFGDAGFTAKDGAQVMRSFGFEQHRTDVAKLLDGSLEYLQESRRSQASNSSADLWQLQIIISDGVCQDHPRLRTLLRKAVEQRVMVVFVVVDSLSRNSAPIPGSTPAVRPTIGIDPAQAKVAPPTARQSILNMQSVSYKQVDGEMRLEMERYLDTFPFEYYVVLRDVQALPEVLSDTLRQWMTRVSSSEE